MLKLINLSKLIFLIINTSIMVTNNIPNNTIDKPFIENKQRFIIEKNIEGIDDKMIISDIPNIDKKFIIEMDDELKEFIKFKFKKGCGTSEFKNNLNPGKIL